MVQFNLLPDVKLEYLKTRRTKRSVIMAAIIASAVALLIFSWLFIETNLLQPRHLNNLNSDIEKYIAELRDVPDIDKVLTIQNQLGALTGLHEQKPAASRVLNYLAQLTPAKASVSQTTVDFDGGTITLNGTADSLVIVNKFADTLKFTKFISEENGEEKNAFSEVVLTSFSVDEEGVNFQIDFKFDPEIFDNTKEIKLIVPNIVSTRSQTEKPSDLFQESNKSGN